MSIVNEAVTSPNLPQTNEDEHFLRIEATQGWRAVNLRELWVSRELLWFFVWRDLKVRYKHTALGVAWVFLRPLLTMIIFAAVFGRLARMPSDGIPYPVFTFVALLPWNYFSTVVGAASSSLVGNAHLLTKVYFPRLMLPSVSVLVGLVDLAVAFVLVIPLLLIYQVMPAWSALFTL